jgi:hypothetical protein
MGPTVGSGSSIGGTTLANAPTACDTLPGVTAYTCSECGETIDGFGAFGNHRKAHRAAGRASGAEARPPKVKSTRRRIEDVQTASDDPATDPEPLAPPPGPAARGTSGRPTVDQPSIRVSPEQTAASVSEVVRDSLQVATLADIVKAFSVAVSELDGAGEAGYLSPIQATQLANLLHEPTVEFVVRRFGGDVNKFKAGLAVLLILVSKGAVHARAVQRKVAGRRAPIAPPVQPAPEDHPYVAGQPSAPTADYTAGAAVPPAPAPTADGRAADVGVVAQNGALAAAMKRQRQVPANLP